ncbi:outer membrane beta-barrel protein [Salinivibrio costicola]|uniref:Porin family protein n=1 Tax=Salinivibrio costicola TaxID=51367 RepID=A0ABX6K8I7_SALCS|nr:outer membrane beta-barrel protein [Salinivibrio costicola]QIR07841.1 porin family protein [Salinivibrio costicola]
MMKKTLLLIALCLPMVANANWFVGGDFATGEQGGTLLPSLNAKGLHRSHTFRINVGKTMDDHWQRYGYVQRHSTQSKKDQTLKGWQVGGGMRYQYPLATNWALVTHVDAGLYRSHYSYSDKELSLDETTIGLVAGTQLGVTYSVSERFSLNTGWRYQRRFGLDLDGNSFKNDSTLYMGASYSF